MSDQRRVWIQRIHAELYQHGTVLPEGEILGDVALQGIRVVAVTNTNVTHQRVWRNLVKAATGELLREVTSTEPRLSPNQVTANVGASVRPLLPTDELRLIDEVAPVTA